MYKFLLSILLTSLLVFCFSQTETHSRPALLKEFLAAEKIFRQAEQLSGNAGDNEAQQEKADEIYKQSQASFIHLLSPAEEAGYDSLAFFTRLRTGFISFYLNDQEQARKDYLAAIALKQKLPEIPDSFLFIHLVYMGGIYYNRDMFDSAMYFYKKAEAIKDTNSLEGSERLFNRLGVMYYETGNYNKARNYFEKAIAVLSAGNNPDNSLLANYRNNIASIHVKLEEYTAAKSVYGSVLPYFNNEVYHNLGIISLKEENYYQAVDYLGQVNYGDNKKNTELYYNLGVAYSELGKPDSSERYFHKAFAENLKWNGHRKNITYGLILRYQADQLARERLYLEAAGKYQHAIIQFDTRFTDPDIFNNPRQYSGIFSYINLFNTLIAKADVLEKLYQQEKDVKILVSSLDAYKSAFRLAEYVEQTYDSDEARLFLGKIKYTVHSNPIDICLRLYDLTRKKNYLEEAWFFDQRNKASILSLNVMENEWKKKLGNGNESLTRESSLKQAITRLSLKASGITDSVRLVNINTAITDKEIELGKVRETIHNDPAWLEKKSIEIIPPVNEMQKKLDNTTALLSFHLSGTELLTLLITASQFDYHKSPVNDDFFAEIGSLRTALQHTSPGLRYNGVVSAMKLYETMISPIYSKLTHIKRLIIIPDDELNYLPFEALQDENKKYLVEKFSVQYQYSAVLLEEDKNESPASSTLAFAPFASTSFTDTAGKLLSSLPASGAEISGLAGKIFMDSAATKNNFLRTANSQAILHLATHASVNNLDPALSFIAFYPGYRDYKLYAGEIYNLKLDSTQLVILSACETGTGQLIKGEGLMSLSRAFAYAGCPNIITSLWKAEDKTTAFMTRRIHEYLEEGFSKDRALQHAKLDLLNSKEIDARFKTPDYWSNLIFIGNYKADHLGNKWRWVAIGVVAILLGYFLIKRKA